MTCCTREELVAYLHEYLSCEDFADFAPNGLQIEGGVNIRTICTAVSASQDAINQAIAEGADALIVHHGYFWRSEAPVIVGIKHKRIASILEHQINLLAYHLPLDCHLEIGNNACLGRLFELNNLKSHTIDRIPNLMWTGELSSSLSFDALSRHIGNKLQREPLHIKGPQKLIRRLAWCSGAAENYIDYAKKLEVDAYLSGEVSERTYYEAKELGLHYYACGHSATERYGILALGQHIAERFGIKHHFIESDNPV